MLEPIVVTARLATGYVAADPWSPALDGILAWAIMRRDHPEMLDVGVLDGDPMEVDVPLERLGDGEDWYYACSMPLAPGAVEHVTWYHKRFDDQHERYLDAGKRRKINAKSGRYKSYRLPRIERVCREVHWHAVGDQAAVFELLALVRHIGKLRAQGMGRVMGWDVVPGGADDARLARELRPIPVDDPDGECLVMPWGLRPPGWWVGNHRWCRMPEIPSTT